jgi:hypothetical protein
MKTLITLLAALSLAGCNEQMYPCYFTVDMHRVCVEQIGGNDFPVKSVIADQEYQLYLISEQAFRQAMRDHMALGLDHMTMVTIIKDELKSKQYKDGL